MGGCLATHVHPSPAGGRTTLSACHGPHISADSALPCSIDGSPTSAASSVASLVLSHSVHSQPATLTSTSCKAEASSHGVCAVEYRDYNGRCLGRPVSIPVVGVDDCNATAEGLVVIGAAPSVSASDSHSAAAVSHCVCAPHAGNAYQLQLSQRTARPSLPQAASDVQLFRRSLASVVAQAAHEAASAAAATTPMPRSLVLSASPPIPRSLVLTGTPPVPALPDERVPERVPGRVQPCSPLRRVHSEESAHNPPLHATPPNPHKGKQKTFSYFYMIFFVKLPIFYLYY